MFVLSLLSLLVYELHRMAYSEVHLGLKALVVSIEMLQIQEVVVLRSPPFTFKSHNTAQAISVLVLLHFSAEGNSML